MSKVTLDSQQMADLAVGLSAAVRWYSKAVESFVDDDSADPSIQVFQQQLDRLRELQALLSCADIEVTKLPQSGEWPRVELAMVRLSAQQASDLIGAIQDAAAHALGFSQALAVAGQTDSALHFEHQRARLAELERLLTADGKRPVAVELVG